MNIKEKWAKAFYFWNMLFLIFLCGQLKRFRFLEICARPNFQSLLKQNCFWASACGDPAGQGDPQRSSNEINEGPLIFLHLQHFAIPSAHWPSHLGSLTGVRATRGQQWERKKGPVWAFLLYLNNNCQFCYGIHTFSWYKYSQGDSGAVYSVKPRESAEDQSRSWWGRCPSQSVMTLLLVKDITKASVRATGAAHIRKGRALLLRWQWLASQTHGWQVVGSPSLGVFKNTENLI